MRSVLILMTIGALISNVISGFEYGQIVNAPQATVFQQIAGLLELGLSSIALIVGVAGLAIVHAIRELPGWTVTRAPSILPADSWAAQEASAREGEKGATPGQPNSV